MRNPSSFTSSPLHAPVESRMHAFKANGTGQIEFWRLGVQALSVQPALCKYSCSQPSGDNLTDVENYFNFVTGHTWTMHFDSGDPAHPYEYQQTDAVDPDTLQPISASADVDTYPGGFNGGGPPVWNNLLGYTYNTPPDPTQFSSTSGDDWDKSATRAGIVAALDGVDWTTLWTGSTAVSGNFQYNRYQLSPAQFGFLPWTDGLPSDTVPPGDLIAFPGAFGPNLVLRGVVGDLGTGGSKAVSVSDDLGVSLFRSQIQIRNFRGSAIPYFIYEWASVAGGVTILNAPFPTNTIREDASIGLADTQVYYRKVSEGVWDHDLQIIQLPDAAMDGPQPITAPLGTRVRNGTTVGMVVGMTFEAWMESILGPSWADHIFT